MSKPVNKANPAPLEITRLRVAVAERGWRGWGELAYLVGCKPDSISSAITLGFAGTETLKWKIEAALNYEEAIFSTPEQIRLRKKIFDATGKDPMLITLSELRALAKKLGTNPGKQTNNSHLWRDAILRFAAVNPL